MATIKVSGKSQLASAMKSAKAGDVLSLAGGNYGSVSLNKGGITIQSASDGSQAVFSAMKGKGVSNLTINNVKFDGTGGGTGLTLSNASNVKVMNSDFTDYRVGSFIYEINGLTVSNNTFNRMYIDAMNFADINNGTISGNTYQESGSMKDYTHKDFIQFWTNKGYNQAASKNIKIVNNKFFSKDGDTHGIFINNEWHGQKYENIYIANNYLKSSQTHGITVSYANGLQVVNNTVIKDGSGTPTINVTPDSTNVKIIGNTAPAIADKGNSTWTISGNKETIPNAYVWTNGQSGKTVANTGGTAGSSTSAAVATDAAAVETKVSAPVSSLDLGNGHADEFRFQGSAVTGTKTATLSHVDFAEHDTLVLIGYDKGTFHDKSGGNQVWVNDTGTYVKIDSAADLKELVQNSKAINAKVSGDTLTLTIEQHGGTQKLVLDGLGDRKSVV